MPCQGRANPKLVFSAFRASLYNISNFLPSALSLGLRGIGIHPGRPALLGNADPGLKGHRGLGLRVLPRVEAEILSN